MKVIQRNDTEQDFCLDKIIKAVKDANESVPKEDQMNEEAIQKVINTVQKSLEGFNSINVEDIQDLVEKALVRHNKYVVSKAYILCREKKKEKKKFTDNEEKVLSLIDGESCLRGDNANKNIDDNGSMRDYFAGILSKSLTNKLLPKDVLKLHKKGLGHFHDADYHINPMHNCDLCDVEDMFTNGFQMQNTRIEPNNETPFRTACNLLAQINLIISGRQYGGQTVSWSHTLPFIEYSRKIIRKNIEEKYNSEENIIKKIRKALNFFNIKTGLYNTEKINSLVESDLRKEIYEGVKTYQYQILCHSSSNGQTPFVSNNICLREAQTEQELKDFAMLIEEILKRRIKGIKDESGHYITPLFPKLLYWLSDGLNLNENDPYFYLTELAAKCEAKRMQPDINSEKECRRIKKGQIIPSMGCVDKDEVVTYRYGGNVYVESIRRMYERFSSIFGEELQDATDCYYINLNGVEIYDSTKEDFVKCLRMNKNADEGDWKCIKLSDGRSLMCTSNHPLAVVGRGRTFVENINVDDCVECTRNAYNMGTEHLDGDYAWLLGVLICDGCYDKQLSSTFAISGEDEIIERYSTAIKKYFGFDTIIKEWNRGVKGNYKEVRATNGTKTKRETTEGLVKLFGGLRKKERQIPQEIFRCDAETRYNFLGGLVDADGYIHYSEKNNFCYVELGSTNKEFALQQMQLALSLGYNAKLLLNKYNSKDLSKIRYRVYFDADEEILKYITCEKKRSHFHKLVHSYKEDVYKVNEIIDCGFRDEYSYDVTTESDRFDVSGIKSHNCRSWLSPIWELNEYPIDTKFYWVKGKASSFTTDDINGDFMTSYSFDTLAYPYGTFVDKKDFKELSNKNYKIGEIRINFRGNTGWLLYKDNEKVKIYQPKVYGRWNNGVFTINLPHVALEAREQEPNDLIKRKEIFYQILDERLEICRKALQFRYEHSSKIKAKNSSILWMYGALARMGKDETVGDLMKKYPKRASISLGYVGLYETCEALIDESNTTKNGQELSLEILKYMNDKCKKWKEVDKMNYSIYGTPEESLTQKFALANRKDFGLIPKITDKDYVVNSYHVDPREHIDAFKKLEIEGKYLALSSGGAVSYIETGDLTKNPEAIVSIFKWMYDHIVYAEVNRKVGVCYECGYEGDMPLTKTEDGKFEFTCPICGNKDDSKMHVTARLCGYLGTVNAGNTNKGRLDDIYNRVEHTDCKDEVQ